MRPIRSLAIYVAVVFGGGALLAPWLYHLAQWAAGHEPALAGLAAAPFHRFVLRAILGLAVLGLWPLLQSCQMLHLRDIGLAGRTRPLARLAGGLAIGFGSLALVAALAILGGGRAASLSHSRPEIIHVLAGVTVAAVVVAILEELIFRGALFGILRKTFPWPVALLGSSAVYASVHFLQKAEAPGPIGGWSGLTLLPRMFVGPADGLGLVPAFFTLLVAGAILALAYQRTGTLFMSMGIHAGWIFWLGSYRFLTRETSHAAQWVWGSDKLIDGWLPLAILTCVFTVMLCLRWPAGKTSH